jgi:dolichol-phosphate mannosyltransferase
MTLLIVLPTYNERLNIERVVAEVMGHDFTRLLVVDDESPDGTGALADALAAQWPGRIDVFHRRGPRGLGLAYVDGLTRAIATGVDAIGQMDADLSHDPSYLPGLEHSDLVIGSRYLHGVSVINWPLHRIVLSAFANRYIRFVTGLRPADCTSGFRVWRREAIARLPLERARANGYAFLTEMLYEAQRHDCRIGEVPIVFVERQEGYSKVSQKVLIESLLTPWRLILRGGRLKSPA